MGKRKAIVLSLLYFIATAFSSTHILLEPDSIEEATTVKIAAFNIQRFGGSKRQKEDVMMVLVRIVREFDIVLVQEIMYKDEKTAPIFLERINEAEGPKYEFIRSERLGISTSTHREAYAYFYNTGTVEFINGSDYVYNDRDEVFARPPYIASFRSDNFDFILVGIHTRPTSTSSVTYDEIGNLTVVVSSIKEANPYERDIIIMGDFNADGKYFDEDETSNPLRTAEFHWLITNEMDTMTTSDNTYDRIVILNSTLNYEYVTGSGSVFYFDEVYEINNVTLVTQISDHYPIFAEYMTNLADDD